MLGIVTESWVFCGWLVIWGDVRGELGYWGIFRDMWGIWGYLGIFGDISFRVGIVPALEKMLSRIVSQLKSPQFRADLFHIRHSFSKKLFSGSDICWCFSELGSVAFGRKLFWHPLLVSVFCTRLH